MGIEWGDWLADWPSSEETWWQIGYRVARLARRFGIQWRDFIADLILIGETRLQIVHLVGRSGSRFDIEWVLTGYWVSSGETGWQIGHRVKTDVRLSID